MTVKRFTPIATRDNVFDRVQQDVAAATASHATAIDSHAASLANGLTFAANFKGEWVTLTFTAPVPYVFTPTKITAPAAALFGSAVAADGTHPAITGWPIVTQTGLGTLSLQSLPGLTNGITYTVTLFLVGG